MSRTKQNGDWQQWEVCPFCGAKDWRFGVNTVTGAYKCFHASCGAKGRDGAYVVRDGKARAVAPEKCPIPPTRILQDERALAYLEKRGVRPDDWNIREGIGYLYGRVVILFPTVCTSTGQVDYWQARSYLPQVQPKYKNPVGQTYPLFKALRAGAEEVVLVEGLFDAMALHRLGYSAAAIGSTHITTVGLEALQRLNPPSVTICLDFGAGGHAFRLYRTIRPVLDCPIRIVLRLPQEDGGLDVADLAITRPERVHEYLRQDVPAM